MPRRSQEPDYAAVWDALTPSDRQMIAATEEKLGIPPGGWRSVPMLRQLARSFAVLEVSRRWPQLSEVDAIDRALEELGVEDDSDRDTSPAASFARLLRRWRTTCSAQEKAATNIV